ncbi:MAG: hypothetical protein GX774_17675 [Armatimonadetes bacterium]|jgi:di/tricarboxylate transporter|nr:hypothetical protein [Armatimonadota bacterium]
MTKLAKWADALGRRHPRLMLLAVAAMAGVATLLLLASGHGTIVLYQAF